MLCVKGATEAVMVKKDLKDLEFGVLKPVPRWPPDEFIEIF